jgi:hypothetical protein
MPATITTEPAVARPEFFRLPKPGVGDLYFSCSRSFYYELERRGDLRLVRIKGKNKSRGVTLVPFQAVANLIRAQMEGGE